uniref:NADH-ubiquinone oxidoreductase chain 5 n=1 Tax=Ectatops sp. TaxID=2931290 RepID=A0A8T9ZXL1_9HEMI|nr:NADH dehydrogenase subunit 5 [Ectatops sp.]
MMNSYSIWSYGFLFIGLMNTILGMYMLIMDMIFFCDWEFISLNTCSFVMTLLFDWMSLLFIGSVFLISSMVIYYSYSYMYSDLSVHRFLYLVVLFVLSMMFMIISPNLVSILIGWDGLGLVSYCLVIYFQNVKSYSAGLLTILVNRLGDISLLFSIAWFLNNGSWHFLYYLFYDSSWFFLLMLLLTLAGFTKSAQIPFSSWLPAAMAAPTPVSALVHSSTLVTAGVYLFIRFNVLFSLYNTSFILVLSVLTMFMSGLGASFEFDLKKIIALSTLSQLGLMMTILLVGSCHVSFFHLLTHAFFKALLFLCAGLIIHCMNDSQDIRFMGSLINQFPFTLSGFCVANMSLCGFPFLSGFYSKDLSIEFVQMSYFNGFVYYLFMLSIGLTMIYSFRLLYYVIYGFLGVLSNCLYEEDNVLLYSMIFLIFMGLFIGSFFSWYIFPFPNFVFLSSLSKLFPLVIVLLSGFLVFIIYSVSIFDSVFGYKIYVLFINFVSNMWFMPNFSTYMVYSSGLNLSIYYEDLISMGWGEYLFSYSINLLNLYLSLIISMLQNNNLKLFFLGFMLLSLFIFM